MNDVQDESIDIVSLTMIENVPAGSALFAHQIFGVIRLPSRNQYLMSADLDDDATTGGAPSTLGFDTTFQGAELVTRVIVFFAGPPEFVQRVAEPTV